MRNCPSITKIGTRLFVLTPGDVTNDFIDGSFGLRRVIQYGSESDVAAVRAELRYLDRLCRRAERRICAERAA